MAYTLGNKCAKNLCKRIVLLQLIIENVVTCFFLEHSVVCSENISKNITTAIKSWPATVHFCNLGVFLRITAA